MRSTHCPRSEAVPEVPGPLSMDSPPHQPETANETRPGRPRRKDPNAGEPAVMVSIPLVAIVGAVVFIAHRYMGLRAWHAVACLLAGFLLAATTAPPEIHAVITAVVRWLSGTKH